MAEGSLGSSVRTTELMSKSQIFLAAALAWTVAVAILASYKSQITSAFPFAFTNRPIPVATLAL